MKANSVAPPTNQESEEQVRSKARPTKVRTASKEQFEKAQRKTSTAHAGLFRRLAQ